MKREPAAALRFAALWWAVGAAGVALVIALSLMQDAPQVPGDTGGGLGHVLAYATLMGWFARLRPPGRFRVAAALCLCTLGIALEFVQGATGYRFFDTADMLANTIGVGLGWLASPPRVPDGLAAVDRLLARAADQVNRSPP